MIQYSIYIVDDEETIREGVTMALEADYQVEAFSTAETAIDAIEQISLTWFCLTSDCRVWMGLKRFAKLRVCTLMC